MSDKRTGKKSKKVQATQLPAPESTLVLAENAASQVSAKKRIKK